MKSLLLSSIFFISIFSFSIKCQEKNNFLTSVFKPDTSVFQTAYLFESFKHWSNELNIKSFEIETNRYIDNYQEFAIIVKSIYNSESRIILLVDKTFRPKVIEIRKEIMPNASEMKSPHNALEFVEQFVWCYEIGKNDYIKDFVFPSFIKMLYKNERDKYKIIEKLRSNFRNNLPISSISWEIHEPYLLLCLELGSSFELLEINVDLRKYLTTLYYNRLNLKSRVASLKDSINIWKIGSQQAFSKEHKIEINANNANQAINIFIKREFKFYDTAVLTQTDSTQTIQVIWPYEITSSTKMAQYLIKAYPSHNESYYIDVEWIPQKIAMPNNINNSLDVYNQVNKLFYNLSYPESVLKEEHQFYQTNTPKFLLQYNSYDNEVIEFKNYNQLNHLFREFSANRPKYVQLRNIIYNNDSLQIDFYIIWKEQNLHIQHYANVSYFFNIHEQNFILQKIMVDLFPFVRSDNISFFLPDPSNKSNTRNRLLLRR